MFVSVLYHEHARTHGHTHARTHSGYTPRTKTSNHIKKAHTHARAHTHTPVQISARTTTSGQHSVPRGCKVAALSPHVSMPAATVPSAGRRRTINEQTIPPRAIDRRTRMTLAASRTTVDVSSPRLPKMSTSHSRCIRQERVKSPSTVPPPHSGRRSDLVTTIIVTTTTTTTTMTTTTSKQRPPFPRATRRH